MSIAHYQHVLSLAQQLNVDEQIQLLQALLSEVASDVKTQNKQASIQSIRGVGKDIWAEIDVEQYIREERASWNG